MKSKILTVIIVVIFLLSGCKSLNSKKAISSLETNATSLSFDHNEYIKKTWIDKMNICNFSFCISEISNRKISGRFTTNVPAVPNQYYLGSFTGMLNNDAAECQFNDTVGNKGSIRLAFKPNNVIEASLKLTNKSQDVEQRPKEGTFQFVTYNLNQIKEFILIKNHSFEVNLNSWGSVNFISGKLTGGEHIPVVSYLANDNGDILYDFNLTLPYLVDIKDALFVDLNKDGLKDLIIVVTGDDGNGQTVNTATVYFQKKDGSFANDPNLDKEINTSENNKDTNRIIEYILKKSDTN